MNPELNLRLRAARFLAAWKDRRASRTGPGGPRSQPRAPLLALLLLAGQLAAAGAQPETLGVLFWHDSPNDRTAYAGFRDGLKAAGLSFRLLERNAHSDPERAAAHLHEFEARHVALVVALGTEAARLAAAELHGTPAVFTAVTDPVATGIVPSWKGSGSFLAGNSNHIDLNRALTDFHRAVPGLRVLGVLHTEGNRVSASEIREMARVLEARASLGIRLQVRRLQPTDDLAAATAALCAGCDALWIPIDYGVYSRMEVVSKVALAHRTPLVTTSQKAMPHAVVAVLPDYHTLGMLAVEIVDRILHRGVEPGAIPVGTMHGRILVINLAAARRLGLEVPIRALATADRILADGGKP